MDRAELIRRAEAIAATDPWPGITRSQMMALFQEANWMRTPPDPEIGDDMVSVFNELHAKGITVLKD